MKLEQTAKKWQRLDISFNWFVQKKNIVEKKGWHPLPLSISPLKELVMNT
jgi:hypothetical protein